MELVPIRHDKQRPPLTTELQDNEGNSQDSRGDRFCEALLEGTVNFWRVNSPKLLMAPHISPPES